MIRTTLAALGACIAITLPASAQTAAPRAVAENIAVLIVENYWSEDIGASIAEELRGRANAGAYDRYTDPRDLASALAADLRRRDTHFNVTYTADAPQQGGPRPPPADPAGQLARSNQGFARVEMLPGGVGYLDVRAYTNFNMNDANAPARRAADAAMTTLEGAQAIIVDQRDCQGGAPMMVGYLAAYFTPDGANIFNTFHSRQGTREEAPQVAPTGARRLETPLYIVNSGRTASACESFAYTLQAAGRATIVGERSAGGANPGASIPVGDGFTVFISLGSPINPITGRNWEGEGVIPTEAAPHAEAVTRAHIVALQALAASQTGDAQREAQWALAALQANGPALSARQMREYAGDYGTRTVTIENGALVLHRDRRPGLRLIPIERDLFAVDYAAPLQRVRFERDARGRIEALTLSLVNGPEFRDLKR
jgi:hypothetical protein